MHILKKKFVVETNKTYRRTCNINDETWSDYRVQRNLVTRLKRISIKRFCMDSAANATTPGGFWRRLKPLLPSSGLDNSDETCIINDGVVVNEPSNLFNEYFSTPALSQDALDLSLEEFSNHPSITSISLQNFNLAFSFQPVSAEYIGKLLSELKINKSCGPDNIPPKILKLSVSTIKEPLTKLINYCITESSWPLDWKRSHITPIYKKDDASSVNNYRTISILSAIPKLLEKVLFDQLYDAFKSEFSINMSGFLRGHSCWTALLKIVDDWRLALDSKKITGSIAIDLSKALDSICHNLLLAKLRAYGLNDDAIAFLQSYLTDRHQRVKFHGKFSEWCPVKCGVPQGSLHGPLLFNIFLNDLNFARQFSSLCLYADDTTTYASDRDIVTLEISLNQDLNILVTWFSQNYLIVNSIKTQGMVLGSHTHIPEFFIGETKVELANSLKIDLL